jgi:hypothetical protein
MQEHKEILKPCLTQFSFHLFTPPYCMLHYTNCMFSKSKLSNTLVVMSVLHYKHETFILPNMNLLLQLHEQKVSCKIIVLCCMI